MPIAGANPRIITPATPNAATVFAQNVAAGTSGNYDEMLLRPAYLALTSPNDSNHNAGFRRADANLSIVIVSDAAEHDAVPLSFYESFYTGLKSGSSTVTVSGMVPTMTTAPTGTCVYDDSNAGQSTKVSLLAGSMGGIVEEICTSNWAGALTRLGQVAFGGLRRTRFELSNQPEPGKPLLLEIDGQPFEAVGPAGETRWTWDAAANAIDFSPAASPAPGARITVTYHVSCVQ